MRRELTSLEFSFVSEQINEAKESLVEAQTFILSASLDGDSLSQWRAYGGASGFAVGLAADERLDLLGEFSFQVPPEADEDPYLGLDAGR